MQNFSLEEAQEKAQRWLEELEKAQRAWEELAKAQRADKRDKGADVVTIPCPDPDCGRRLGAVRNGERGPALTSWAERPPEWTGPKHARVEAGLVSGTAFLDDDDDDEVYPFDCSKHGHFELTAGEVRLAVSRGYGYLPANKR